MHVLKGETALMHVYSANVPVRALFRTTYCMLCLRLSWGGCRSLSMHLNSNTEKKKG